MKSFASFSDFEEGLLRRLEGDLPGKEAHSRMAGAHYIGWPEPVASSRSSAVLILFYPTDDGIRFPLIQRPTYEGVHSGQIAFPGGKVDPTDQDLNDTALREAWEEIGVPPGDVKILGQLSEIYIKVSDMKVVPVIGTLAAPPSFIPDPREVERVFEIKLADISELSSIETGRIPIRGGYLTVPFYNYQGQKIWGATAMMISELLEIIEG
jgi:8-oxo-dGTP pyrophosphatase MutT (NUDIX family)